MKNIIQKIKDFFLGLKMFRSKSAVKGRVKLECHDANGILKWSTGWMTNIITNGGLGAVSGLVGNVGSETAFGYLALGTDSTVAAQTQTALIAEITTGGLERAAATVTQETTTTADDTLQFVKQWTSSASHTVEEIGIFNASISGIMLGRKVTGSKSLISGETLTATYQVIFANA